MAYQDVQKVAEKRRTIYALNKNLPLPAAEVAKIIEHAVLHTPSSFNSQSTRVVVLFGAEHEKLWQITEDALRAIVPADKFEPTAQKLAMFKANFPAYADNFPVWAEHTDAMHQYAVWTTLAEAGIGANLQHYNPLIDNAVAEAWDIPASWRLRAEMVFGGIAAPAGEKAFAPLEGRFKVHGA